MRPARSCWRRRSRTTRTGSPRCAARWSETRSRWWRSSGPTGVVVERLLEAGVRVLALHPNQVKAPRDRFRASGGKSDRFDRFVLCELARTDSHRFRILEPDSDAYRSSLLLPRPPPGEGFALPAPRCGGPFVDQPLSAVVRCRKRQQDVAPCEG